MNDIEARLTILTFKNTRLSMDKGLGFYHVSLESKTEPGTQ